VGGTPGSPCRSRIAGAAGSTEVTFTQRVLAQRRFSTVLLIGLPFLAVLAGMAGFWYFRSSARPAAGM